MDQVLVMATALVAVVSGVVQAIKKTNKVPVNYLPVVAMFAGIFIGACATTVLDATLFQLMWAGGIAGLASCGLYDGIAKNTKKENGGNENGN